MFSLRQLIFGFNEELVNYAKELFKVIKKIFIPVWWLVKTLVKILWKRISSFLSNVGDETGILALKLMFNRNLHTLERFFWFFTSITAIYGALFLTKFHVIRHIKSPTVISVDRNYRDWVGFMPAITLCYYDHIDLYKANKYIMENWNVSIIDEDYFYFMDFLNAVVNASASNYANLAKFAEDERFDDLNLYDIVQAIDKPFEQIINTYEGNFEISVTTAMTERGLCYVINSAMGEVLGAKLSSKTFDDLKHPLKCEFGKQKCFIKIDLLESTGVIDVHSPYEISSTDAIALQKSDEIIASYKVMETVASPNLRNLGVDQRKCLFNDEGTSELKIYSKSLCLAKCRATKAMEMCNCVPFFYAFVGGKACNPAGFECLLDFQWPVWALHICKCPDTCIEIEYTLQTVKKSSWGISIIDDAGKSDVVTSSFRWDLIPPKVRMRRDVVFSFEDLLVSFGGTLALFLGFSILSLVDMIFALAKRILQDIYDLMQFICKCCRFFRNLYIKRQKLQKEIVTADKAKVSDKISFARRTKQRREKLLKMHLKSSEDFVDVKKNTLVEKCLLKETKTNSVFEFVN